MGIEQINRMLDEQLKKFSETTDEELDQEMKWIEKHGPYIKVQGALPDEFEKIWQRIQSDDRNLI